MATDQDSIKLYLPADDAAWIRQHCDDEGKTVAGLLRVLIRKYRVEVDSQKAAA